eukprot:CAMPEP_0202692782 /NCGR_PEP_ID=MMETSP1385-20130828/7086_1 /ASSEMBLY_ACC=CAM_ASM_000861 /TAXON_ID=933848 /ORGANISM="Elphidium margaritaceum" /LENGTH=661 /DNA_ID=CAMNT_0049348377 /DNA_START=20 /DNA_END=2005 /DNA_ORIENTATION=+
MGKCCSSTQPENRPNTQKFSDAAREPLTADNGYHTQAAHVVMSDDDDHLNGNNNGAGNVTTQAKSSSAPQPDIEQRIKTTHEKLKLHENKALEEADTSSACIENKALINKLIVSPPSNSEQSSDQQSAINNVHHPPFYDLISTEHLRYVVTDLIEQHNALYAENDVVSAFAIRKLLSKWSTPTAMVTLYNTLLDEYHVRHKLEAADFAENTMIHRLCSEYRINAHPPYLGQGSYATVMRAQRVADGRWFAAKLIKKVRLTKAELRGLQIEIALMRELDHPNVVRLYDVYVARKQIVMMMGLLEGGELIDVIIRKKRFSERQASACFAQLLTALQYIHKLHIAHRDLKPENLLFSMKITDAMWNNISRLPPNALKLADFGLAEKCYAKKPLYEFCGSYIYIAPEIWSCSEKGYDYACDMWSAGCILHALLLGTAVYDFDSRADPKALGRAVVRDPVVFDAKNWRGVSAEAKDLCAKLLEKNPRKRYTATQALEHEWMRTASETLFDRQKMDRMRQFNCARKFKRGVRAMLAVIRLSEIFERLTEEKARFDETMGDTHENVNKVAEQQENVLEEIDKMHFVMDKLEDRINQLEMKKQAHLDEEKDGHGVHTPLSDAHGVHAFGGDSEAEDDHTAKTKFDKPSSLHQTSTFGRIAVPGDDDDSD